MRRLSSSGLHDKSPGQLKAHPGPREWKQVTAGFKLVTGRRVVPALILLICMMSLLHRMRDQGRISASQNSRDLQGELEVISLPVLSKTTDLLHASAIKSEAPNTVPQSSIRSASKMAITMLRSDQTGRGGLTRPSLENTNSMLLTWFFWICSVLIPVANLWSNGHSTGWRASCAARSSDWYSPRGSNGYLVVRCDGGLSQHRTAVGLFSFPLFTVVAGNDVCLKRHADQEAVYLKYGGVVNLRSCPSINWFAVDDPFFDNPK